MQCNLPALCLSSSMWTARLQVPWLFKYENKYECAVRLHHAHRCMRTSTRKQIHTLLTLTETSKNL